MEGRLRIELCVTALVRTGQEKQEDIWFPVVLACFSMLSEDGHFTGLLFSVYISPLVYPPLHGLWRAYSFLNHLITTTN